MGPITPAVVYATDDTIFFRFTLIFHGQFLFKQDYITANKKPRKTDFSTKKTLLIHKRSIRLLVLLAQQPTYTY